MDRIDLVMIWQGFYESTSGTKIQSDTGKQSALYSRYKPGEPTTARLMFICMFMQETNSENVNTSLIRYKVRWHA